ncbi:MAG: aldo/keto reductase [Elusimicrobiota bacterium]|jgi:aryl-alcohol dehydrogenase-like predicted oxidoreductase
MESASLVLGTVQLGVPYGVANKAGQPDQALATEIVRTAWMGGVREFDTAQDYGTSEAVLGEAFVRLGISAQAMVISKIDPGLDHGDRRVMAEALERSLARLGVPRLWGLMIHKEELLCRWRGGLGKILQGFVAEGKISHVGVSVYSPERALEALDLEGVGMIQVPSNILDRRFERNKVFERAAQKNKQVYVRSVFLQGLILMAPDDLSSHMHFAGPVLEKIAALAHELNVTRHELALGYLKAGMPGAKLLVGAETPGQVKENLSAYEKQPPLDIVPLVLKYFDQVEEKILNPTLWGR